MTHSIGQLEVTPDIRKAIRLDIVSILQKIKDMSGSDDFQDDVAMFGWLAGLIITDIANYWNGIDSVSHANLVFLTTYMKGHEHQNMFLIKKEQEERNEQHDQKESNEKNGGRSTAD